MVALRRKTFRATSVPAVRLVNFDEPATLPDPIYHSHRTRLISNAALDASDALSAASKRNDQYLIKEINDRLAHAALSHPQPFVRRRHSVSRAPSVPRPLSIASVNVMTPSKPSAVDNDVSRDVELMMPMTSRVLRAGSVPPSLDRAALVPLYYGHPAVQYVKPSPVVRNGIRSALHLNGPLNHGYYVPPVPIPYTRYFGEPYVDQSEGADAISIDAIYRPPKVPIPDSSYYYPLSTARLTPSSDIAVRQAHRDLDRIEHELKTDATLSPPAAPVPIIRTYATMEAGPSLRRRTAYYGGPVTGLTNPGPIYYLGSTHSAYQPSYASSLYPSSYISSSYLPSYSAYLPSYSAYLPSYASTAYLPSYSAYLPSYSGYLPSYSGSAYLPRNYSSYSAAPIYHSGATSSYLPASDVLTIKKVLSNESDYYPTFSSSAIYQPDGLGYSSALVSPSTKLSSNIDALLLASKTSPGVSTFGSYVRPSSAHVTSYTSPPLPASFPTPSAPASQPTIKPQMSQARRRARDVLCRVKNDPKYFDN